uniref:Uncharacterized protein n=1 Tax=Sarcophilus harrisii TaxID=9305 RepID=A0A7N4P4N2_SARHA
MGPGKEANEESVILISDDETDAETTLGNSVVVIDSSDMQDDKSDLEEKKSEEIVDEESGLVVTFCKKGMVMPHARYDCMTHPFERTENETCIPVKQNSDMCGQCYCYVCDKLASKCQYWTTSSSCHCNAHNKSKFWKDQRNFTLTGVLVIFNLEPAEIDTDLRHGGELLFKFLRELSIQYNNYLSGEIVLSLQDCVCPSKQTPGQCSVCSRLQNEVIYRYSDVFNLVSSFINKAEKEKPKTAAIMLLGAAREIALHKDPAQYVLIFACWDPFPGNRGRITVTATNVCCLISCWTSSATDNFFYSTIFDSYLISHAISNLFFFPSSALQLSLPLT